MIKYHTMFSKAKIPSVLSHNLTAKEDTKEKQKRSREEVKEQEREAREEEEDALQDMVQAEVGYWDIQERYMIK